jgi:hypothetical protein
LNAVAFLDEDSVALIECAPFGRNLKACIALSSLSRGNVVMGFSCKNKKDLEIKNPLSRIRKAGAFMASIKS